MASDPEIPVPGRLQARRAALANQMLQGPRVTGTIGPIQPQVPFMRAGNVPVPTALINQAGEAVRNSAAGIPFGGAGQFMANVGTPFLRPNDTAAAGLDIAPQAKIVAAPFPAIRNAYNRLRGGSKAALEAAANTVPNPFEESNR